MVAGCRISSDDEFMVTSSVDGVFQWRVVDAEEDEEDMERIQNAAAVRLKGINDQWGDEDENEAEGEEEEDSPGLAPVEESEENRARLGVDKRLLQGEEPAVFAGANSTGMGMVSWTLLPFAHSVAELQVLRARDGPRSERLLRCVFCSPRMRLDRLRERLAAIAWGAKMSTTLQQDSLMSENDAIMSAPKRPRTANCNRNAIFSIETQNFQGQFLHCF